MEDNPVPEPYYLHQSQSVCVERWQELRDLLQEDEIEVMRRPMRDGLKRFL